MIETCKLLEDALNASSSDEGGKITSAFLEQYSFNSLEYFIGLKPTDLVQFSLL